MSRPPRERQIRPKVDCLRCGETIDDPIFCEPCAYITDKDEYDYNQLEAKKILAKYSFNYRYKGARDREKMDVLKREGFEWQGGAPAPMTPRKGRSHE